MGNPSILIIQLMKFCIIVAVKVKIPIRPRIIKFGILKVGMVIFSLS